MKRIAWLFLCVSAALAQQITSLSPSSAPGGSPAFPLTINGEFLVGTITTVQWTFGQNTTSLSPTSANGTQVIVNIPANLVTTPGTAQVAVAQGTATSNQLPFTITLPPPTITSINPTQAQVNSPGFTLTVNGSNYYSSAGCGPALSCPNSVVQWNGSSLATTFVNSGQLTATVPASLLTSPGTEKITVITGNLTSNTATFTVLGPPTLTGITPSSATAGGPSFTLTANGSNFTTSSIVQWNNNTNLTTTFVSASQLQAIVPAALIAQPNTTVPIVVVTPGSATTGPQYFTVNYPPIVLTSLSPTSAPAGTPGLTLTVNGSGFFNNLTVVTWNGTRLPTLVASPTQLMATVASNLLATPGTATVSAVNPNQNPASGLIFTISASGATISSLSPNSAQAGSPGFNLQVNGANFTSASVVYWNGNPISTNFLSATQLLANVPATLIATPNTTAQVSVFTAGQGMTNALPFMISYPPITLTSISPNSAPAGSAALTLTVNGSGFFNGLTVVTWNGANLVTTFVSSTQLTAAVPASLLATAGTATVNVDNPGQTPPTGVAFAITTSAITVSSISPSSALAGSAAFTLTVTGTGFASGLTAFWNNTALTTTFVSSTQATANVTADLIAQAGTSQISVANSGGQRSNTVPFTVTAPLTLTSISPTSANAGGPAFTLTVNGTGFANSSTVRWNGSALATTFVSATQLTAAVTAALIANPGNASVTVANGDQTSNALTFTINSVTSTPTLTSISPSSATAGDPDTTITVSGVGFVSQTTVQWNGSALPTTFNSATQVTAAAAASLLASPGSFNVTAVNPGNLVSNALGFTVNAKAAVSISSLSKTSATAGDAAFTLTITGTAFTSASSTLWNGAPLATTFVSATQLTAAVPANLLAAPGSATITVADSGVTSNGLRFTINLPPPPSLLLSAPATVTAAQQPNITFGLNAGYPIPLSGTVTLAFAPNATVPVDDPNIQFPSGGRSMSFSVAANTTTLPTLQIQTGTVAGTITLTVRLTAAGTDVTPPNATATIQIGRTAPVIRTVTLVRNAGGFEVDIVGFSTTRDMTQATFHFNPAPNSNIPVLDFTVPLATLFTGWYQSSQATQYGSQFTYAQPFTVNGDTSAIASVTVTLTNTTGASSPSTSN